MLSGVDPKTLNLDPDQGPDPDPGLPHTNNFDRKNSKYCREKLFSIKQVNFLKLSEQSDT